MAGKLIIIESGTDGSGKATQTKRLCERLIADNINVKRVEFPNYQSDSSALIKMYLNGTFGKDPDAVNPYVASTFYAVDRFASYKTQWEEFYLGGGIILSDRYTTSNMVHQAAKLQGSQRDAYLDWLWDFEFNIYKLPTPDCVIFLDVPPDCSQGLMANRNNKYTGESAKDIHESNLAYLTKSYSNSQYVADKYNWQKIQCVVDGKMRSIQAIHEDIYEIVRKML